MKRLWVDQSAIAQNVRKRREVRKTVVVEYEQGVREWFREVRILGPSTLRFGFDGPSGVHVWVETDAEIAGK
jgi:nitrous oxidase accessory protein NosD